MCRFISVYLLSNVDEYSITYNEYLHGLGIYTKNMTDRTIRKNLLRCNNNNGNGF